MLIDADTLTNLNYHTRLLSPGLVLMLNSGSCSPGKCPKFPSKAFLQSQILYLVGVLWSILTLLAPIPGTCQLVLQPNQGDLHLFSFVPVGVAY